MQDLLGSLTGQLNLNIGKLDIPVPYWQAIAVIVLVFFLIMLLARYRRHMVNFSLRGAIFGIFFGFFLALIIEGFLIIGGRTALTSVLGWKDPPPFIASALDSGKTRLIQVLGITTEIPSSYAGEAVSVQSAIQTLQRLNPADTETVKSIFCK